MVDGITFKFGDRSFDQPSQGFDYLVGKIREYWDGEAREVKGTLLEYLRQVAQVLYDRNSQSFPTGTTSSSLSSRTGQSAQSILRSVQVKGTTWDTLSGVIGGRSSLVIHEYGGTITGSGKLLAIPLQAALSASGTSPPFTRQWKNTFVQRSRAGNLIIFQKRVTGIVPLYVLKPSVRIPARLGMRQELDEQVPYFMQQALDKVSGDFSEQLGR